MMHEASLHEDNQFVTLTYDDDHLPKDQSVDQTHMQLFFKRLRKYYAPQKLRFVYCAEYGGKHSRPHYHAIIFGLSLPDLEIYDKNERGEPIYSSETLDAVWQNGETKSGAVTEQSCGYVAGYMLKDINGNYRKDEPYLAIDTETGESHLRAQPFARYSNKPGIGRAWIEKYMSDVFPSDEVIITGGLKRQTPDYYVNQYKRTDPEGYDQLKERRATALESEHYIADNTKERLRVKAICRNARMGLKTRGTIQPENETIVLLGAGT